MSDFHEERLRAFCEGLGMCNIDKLMTGTVADFRKIGEVMRGRIIEIKSEGFTVPADKTEMLIVIKRCIDLISKERDKLVLIKDALDNVIDPTEEGLGLLDDAIDAFTQI